MKAGEIVEARLRNPLYVGNQLAVPVNTLLRGRVISLRADNKTRWHGRLRGDFTPFHTAEVRFEYLVLPSGSLPISATVAADGAPVLRLVTPGASPHRSFFGRYWAQAKSQAHDRVAYFTAPGFGDRALQLLYHQLPYHPERIEAQTAWSFELAAPAALPGFPAAPTAPGITPGLNPGTWSIHAELSEDLTSATAKPGD
jgi:hypothetical protein